MVDSGLISGRLEPKTIQIGIHSFFFDVQQLMERCEASAMCGGWAGGSLT